MKRVFAIALVAVMLLMVSVVPAFAEVSPTAKPEDKPTSGSSTSPQTGDTVALYGTFAVLMAAAASVLAVKKIKE